MADTTATPKKRKAEDDGRDAPKQAKRPQTEYTSFVTVKAGKEQMELLVHEDLLCKNSPFFKAALSKEWKENQTRAVSLEHFSAPTCKRYIDWIYTGKVYEGELESAASDEFPTNMSPEQLRLFGFLESAAKLWVLADFLQDNSCKSAVMGAIVKSCVEAASNLERFRGRLVRYIQHNTSPGSPLHRWLVDCMLPELHRVNIASIPAGLQTAILQKLSRSHVSIHFSHTLDINDYLERAPEDEAGKDNAIKPKGAT